MATPPDFPTARPNTGVLRSFAAFRSISALMLREMSTSYGGKPGGYVWAILEPLGAILILSFGFSLLIRTPPMGNSFVLFYATGFLPFSLYMDLSNVVARSLNFSRPLLAYPSVSWIDALLARLILNALTNVLVCYLIFTGILLFTDTRTVVEIMPIVTAFSLAILLSMAIGTLNCVIGGLFPTWDMLWSIATRPLFLVSGVFFTFDSMPSTLQDYLWWNPLVHIIGLTRQGFYPMYHGQYISVAYVLLLSMIILFFGLLLMRRYHRVILTK